MKCLMKTLIVDELDFCCIWNFMRETKSLSARKIAQALGVHPTTVQYWREKFIRREIKPCSTDCRHLHKPCEFRMTDGGKPYFVRSGFH